MTSQISLPEGAINPSCDRISPALLELLITAMSNSNNEPLPSHRHQSNALPLDALDSPVFNKSSKSPRDGEMKQAAADMDHFTSGNDALQDLGTSCPSTLKALLIDILRRNVSKAQAQAQAECSEALANFRIQVTVLENELKHAREGRDGLVTGLATVIGIMSGAQTARQAMPLAIAKVSTDEQTTRELEKEIERLRRENKGLRSKLRELSDTNVANMNANLQDYTLPQSTVDLGYVTNIPAKLELAKTRNVGNRLAGNGQTSGPTPMELAGSWASQQDILYSEGFGFGGNSGYESSKSTIPNNDVPKPDVAFANNVDVGISSLEDVLESNAFGASSKICPSPKTDTPHKPYFPSLEEQVFDGYLPNDFNIEDEKTINEYISEHDRAIAKSNNIPVPGVLRVGGIVKDNFRGNDYDPTSIQYPKGPRGWRANPHQQPMYRHQRNDGRDLDTEHAKFIESVNESQLSFPNSTWNTSEEREEVLKEVVRSFGNGRAPHFPDFFRYGIQFVPGEMDSNYMRTVHIEHLPPNTNLRDVLARVRGGGIMSATLLDTKALMGGLLSARVVFKAQSGAEEYVKWVNSHPVTFPSETDQGNHKAIVILIPTPTYPPCPRVEQKLSYASRCICIPHVPRDLSIRALQYDLAFRNKVRENSLLEIWLDEDSTLHMEYSSVNVASSAIADMSSWQSLRNAGIEAKYEGDPCAGPLQELLKEMKPRPRFLPDSSSRNRLDSLSIAEQGGLGAPKGAIGGMPRIADSKIIIPSFSGTSLRAASWADEVNEESGAGGCVGFSPSTLKHQVTSSMPLVDCSNSQVQEDSSTTASIVSPFSAPLPQNFEQLKDSDLAGVTLVLNTALSAEDSATIQHTSTTPKIESSNPAYRATNMKGGMNPDEISLDH